MAIRDWFSQRTLKSPDPASRVEAIRALAASGGAKAATAIAEALQDGDADVRAAAAKALGDQLVIGATPALHTVAQSDSNKAVRTAATHALSDIGYGLMRSLFSDRDYGLVWSPYGRGRSDGLETSRANASSMLNSIGPVAIEPLIALVNDLDRDKRNYNDRNKDARERAVWALSEIGTSSGVDAIIQALGHSEYKVSNAAEGALRAMGAGAVSAVTQAMSNGPANVRMAAQKVLGHASADGNQAATEVLVKKFRSGDLETRMVAADELRRVKWTPTDLNERVLFGLASFEIGEVGQIGAEAVPALLDLVNDRTRVARSGGGLRPPLRSAVIWSLARIGDPRSFDALAKAFVDQSCETSDREKALEALVKIDRRAAVPHFVSMLRNEDDRPLQMRVVEEAAKIRDAKALEGIRMLFHRGSRSIDTTRGRPLNDLRDMVNAVATFEAAEAISMLLEMAGNEWTSREAVSKLEEVMRKNAALAADSDLQAMAGMSQTLDQTKFVSIEHAGTTTERVNSATLRQLANEELQRRGHGV
jgi:HEAT repeat protein